MTIPVQRVMRVGIFYDGMYFYRVSNYYKYNHHEKSRININGLHEYVRDFLAREDGVDISRCRITEAHYFRGKKSAYDEEEQGNLLQETVFNDLLIKEGVTTHYLPLGWKGEKGVDVWLALEAFEYAAFNKIDVCVLVTGDGDFLPLVRKITSLGTRVMLLYWDFVFTDESGEERQTLTSDALVRAVTYPRPMHSMVEEGLARNDPMVAGLFMTRTTNPQQAYTVPRPQPEGGTRKHGRIISLREGYGFIRPDGGTDNVFFHYSGIRNVLFDDLSGDEAVSFAMGKNDRGDCAVDIFVESA